MSLSIVDFPQSDHYCRLSTHVYYLKSLIQNEELKTYFVRSLFYINQYVDTFKSNKFISDLPKTLKFIKENKDEDVYYIFTNKYVPYWFRGSLEEWCKYVLSEKELRNNKIVKVEFVLFTYFYMKDLASRKMLNTSTYKQFKDFESHLNWFVPYVNKMKHTNEYASILTYLLYMDFTFDYYKVIEKETYDKDGKKILDSVGKPISQDITTGVSANNVNFNPISYANVSEFNNIICFNEEKENLFELNFEKSLDYLLTLSDHFKSYKEFDPSVSPTCFLSLLPFSNTEIVYDDNNDCIFYNPYRDRTSIDCTISALESKQKLQSFKSDVITIEIVFKSLLIGTLYKFNYIHKKDKDNAIPIYKIAGEKEIKAIERKVKRLHFERTYNRKMYFYCCVKEGLISKPITSLMFSLN